MRASCPRTYCGRRICWIVIGKDLQIRFCITLNDSEAARQCHSRGFTREFQAPAMDALRFPQQVQQRTVAATDIEYAGIVLNTRSNSAVVGA